MPVASFILVDCLADAQDVCTEANWTPHWVERDGRTDDSRLLRDALARYRLPPGDGYVWIGAEAAVARALRTELVEARGHPKSWLKAAGYWVRGAAGAHEKLSD